DPGNDPDFVGHGRAPYLCLRVDYRRGGVAGLPPDGDKAPIATVPMVSPLRSWRRVGCGGSVCAAAPPPSRFTFSASFIVVSSVRIAESRAVVDQDLPL